MVSFMQSNSVSGEVLVLIAKLSCAVGVKVEQDGTISTEKKMVV
jgi:hypothetical protein